MKLSIPVICECGFSTMDARKAMNHNCKHLTLEEALKIYRECKPETVRCVGCPLDDRQYNGDICPCSLFATLEERLKK